MQPYIEPGGCYLDGHDTSYVSFRGTGQRMRRCHGCLKETNRKAANARHGRLRQAAFDAYGTTCACCGEPDLRFLAIDHVDGDGASHRKLINASGSTSTYRWLAKNGYPPGFQPLCHNCNYAKHVYGTCPHKEVMPL